MRIRDLAPGSLALSVSTCMGLLLWDTVDGALADAPATDTKWLLFWLSLPVAVISFLWCLSRYYWEWRSFRGMTVGQRLCLRRVTFVAQTLLTLGTTACFVLVVFYVLKYPFWKDRAEVVVGTLMGALTVLSWLLLVADAARLVSEQKHRRQVETRRNNDDGIEL
ncbi:hypothetical protein G7046_g10005 [Stylonectria norvegica]|nr:hypothetical protein G7046_g10005 [Stylonectria norvegica]